MYLNSFLDGLGYAIEIWDIFRYLLGEQKNKGKGKAQGFVQATEHSMFSVYYEPFILFKGLS